VRYINVQDDQTLVFDTTNQPSVSNNDCLIKVKAAGVNRADLLQKAGKYPPPKGSSSILGLEVCGEVVSTGENVKGVEVGDSVMALLSGGGYAEYVNVDARHVLPLPDDYSIIDGGGFMETFVTAFQALFDYGKLQTGQKVLIHAGASGVGTAAISLAKAIGCHVVVTASTEEKCKACIELGADVAINYKNQDFVSVCKELNTFFHVVVDVVAGDYVNRNLSVMNPDGHIVILSILGGRFVQKLDIAKMLQKRVSIHASTLRNRTDDYKASLIARLNDQFGHLLSSSNPLKPTIYKAFDWNCVEQAHELLAENQSVGKVVLTLN